MPLHRDSAVNGKSTTPTQSIRQNYTSVYSFACDVVAMPKHRYCVEQPPSMAVYAMLNVPHGMGYPARMPVVPNRNEFFALQKTRSQKCTRMYIFDEVVAVGFNTLCYDAKRRGIKPSARIKPSIHFSSFCRLLVKKDIGIYTRLR